jgi:hypothetical protein
MEYPSPSGIYIGELEQDKSSGKLSTKSIQAVDTKPISGAMNLCAGSLTPWNTHLGGEEDDPDGAWPAVHIRACRTLCWGHECRCSESGFEA